MKKIAYLMFFTLGFSWAQETKETNKKNIQDSNNLTAAANEFFTENKVKEAEINYRKAISKDNSNVNARYNLGNSYYEDKSYNEALVRYKQAAEIAENKTDKHRAYHNLGNVFMKNKKYKEAVEAYKQALRNNPKDNETRYNLALAKEMLKKEEENKKPENKDNKDKEQDKKDQNKDKDKDKDKKDDKKDGDKDKKDDEGEKNNKGDKDKDGKSNKDPEEEKKDPKDSKGNNKKDDQKKQQQPRKNKLSPQQVQNLLQAMKNEEKKVQEKMNAKKVKGVQRKNQKDW